MSSGQEVLQMGESDWQQTARKALKVVLGAALSIVLAGVLFAYFQSVVVVVLVLVSAVVVYHVFKKYIAGTYLVKLG